ncbi:jg16377 [Pararge aegeria aegeria]|uniref:Jg16377 protein n=1 Tax=Pararge aegeria aegeria TaxID=348720 RepID=A0A8S4S9V5_9NEOP|nr:jg16377 [Pararge aegeria aegeria]
MPGRRMEEFEIDRKPTRKPAKQKFYEFLYNEETGAIMGRTPESWVKKIEATLLLCCLAEEISLVVTLHQTISVPQKLFHYYTLQKKLL